MARRRGPPRKVAPGERWVTFGGAPYLPEPEVEVESARAARRRETRMLGKRSERLAEALARLPPRQVAALKVPEALRDAVQELARLGPGNARARQLRFLARLVRETGADAVAGALDLDP